MPLSSSSRHRAAYRRAYQQQRLATFTLLFGVLLFCAIGSVVAWFLVAPLGDMTSVGLWLSLTVTILLAGCKLFEDSAKLIGLLPATTNIMTWAVLLRGWWKSHLFVLAPLIVALWISWLHPFAGTILALLGCGISLLVRGRQNRGEKNHGP